MNTRAGLAAGIVLALLLAGCGGDARNRARQAQVAAIGETGAANDEQYAMILDAFETGDTDLRATAAWALGAIGRPEAREPLLAAAEDGEATVRLNVVTALGEFDGEAVEAALVGALDDEDPAVRAAALRSLASPRFAGAAEAVGRILGEQGDPELAELALAALAGMGATDNMDAFLEASRSEDADLRSLAAFSLGKLRDPAAIPILEGMLDDPSWQVRANAAQALGMIGDPAARPLLAPLLVDPHTEVRGAAEIAIGKLGAS